MGSQFRCFEDYQIGQKGVTHTRTVTEVDITNFGGIVGDYSREHFDLHYMAESVYGERVAHGQLGASLVAGMLSLVAPQIVGRGVPGAYFWSFDVNYRAGIKVGDTIKITWNVIEKADDPAHQGFGVVKTAYQALNQEGVPVYDGILSTLAGKASAKDARLELKPPAAWEPSEFIFHPEDVYCLEDYIVGGGSITEGRTITETDILAFAALTGDYNQQYVDADFARQTQFGERIAHGLLTFSIINAQRGRVLSRNLQPKSQIAGHLSDGATFLAPVKIGDTIRCCQKILATRVSRSKPELGILNYGMQALNQRGEVVVEGYNMNLIPTREGLRKQGITAKA